MADAPGDTALTKFGPMAAWIGGAVLMVVFVLVAFVVGDTDSPKRKIDDVVSQVNGKLNDQKAPNPAPELKGVQGLRGADKSFGVVVPGAIPPRIADEHKILDLPLQFRVLVQDPETDARGFEACDADKDGRLSTYEYENTAKYAAGIKFRTLDKNRDGYLSQSEYDATPSKEDIDFDRFDKNDDGVLSQREYEDGTGNSDFAAKDKNKDGMLSREEFGAKPVEKPLADLGAPSGVKASADAKKFEIAVSWSAPSLGNAPDDLGYWVLRKSPRDLEDRKRRYRTDDLPKWQKRADDWDKERKAWKGSDEAFLAKFGPRPVRPPEPSEWELLNLTPVKESSFIDITFKPEYTYIYAVRATTQEKLKPGTAADLAFAAGYSTSAQAVMTGRPVVVYNRVQMSWAAKPSDTAVKIKLRKFHAINGAWRPVEVTQEVQQGEEIGGNWDVATMKSRGLNPIVVLESSAPDAKPSPELLKALESSREKVDFTTGWNFNQWSGSDVELGQKGGSLRFVLPRDTRDAPSTPDGDFSDLANPISVRLVCMSKAAATARFELTQWKEVEGKWYRVVCYSDVKKSDAIGNTKEQLASLKQGEMIFFFDDGGLELKDAALIVRLGLRDLSFETGLTLTGLDKRTLDLGGSKMDMFGVVYVDRK